MEREVSQVVDLKTNAPSIPKPGDALPHTVLETKNYRIVYTASGSLVIYTKKGDTSKDGRWAEVGSEVTHAIVELLRLPTSMKAKSVVDQPPGCLGG